MKRGAIPILVGALLAAPIPAEGKAVTLDCHFTTYATAEGLTAQRFGFRLSYDTITGDAFMVGNNGVAPLRLVVGDLAISFIEELTSGALQTTTVLLSTGEAVHSRHTVAFDAAGGHSIFSQNYGACVRN